MLLFDRDVHPHAAIVMAMSEAATWGSAPSESETATSLPISSDELSEDNSFEDDDERISGVVPADTELQQHHAPAEQEEEDNTSRGDNRRAEEETSAIR